MKNNFGYIRRFHSPADMQHILKQVSCMLVNIFCLIYTISSKAMTIDDVGFNLIAVV